MLLLRDFEPTLRVEFQFQNLSTMKTFKELTTNEILHK